MCAVQGSVSELCGDLSHSSVLKVFTVLLKVRSTHVQFGVSPQVYERLMDRFPFLLVPVPLFTPFFRHVSRSWHVSCYCPVFMAVPMPSSKQ